MEPKEKILKVIESCQTAHHIESCRKYLLMANSKRLIGEMEWKTFLEKRRNIFDNLGFKKLT